MRQFRLCLKSERRIFILCLWESPPGLPDVPVPVLSKMGTAHFHFWPACVASGAGKRLSAGADEGTLAGCTLSLSAFDKIVPLHLLFKRSTPYLYKSI